MDKKQAWLQRQRAELTDAATGKLLATASGSWMPL